MSGDPTQPGTGNRSSPRGELSVDADVETCRGRPETLTSSRAGIPAPRTDPADKPLGSGTILDVPCFHGATPRTWLLIVHATLSSMI